MTLPDEWEARIQRAERAPRGSRLRRKADLAEYVRALLQREVEGLQTDKQEAA